MSDFQSDYPSGYPSSLPERNPVTRQAHRRQVLWQITLPLILGAIVVIAVGVLSFFGSASTASLWADISLIWLILPSLLGVLILTVIVAGVAYGVIWVIRILPRYALQAQDLVALIGDKIKQAGDAVVAPILKVQGIRASWRAFWRKLAGRR